MLSFLHFLNAKPAPLPLRWLFFLGLILPGLAQAQCPSADITLSTQAQVNAFPPGCTNFANKLTISGADIANLNGLRNLTSVDGTLQISNNAQLTNLTGLGNLQRVGYDFQINSNPTLTSIAALTALTSVDNNLQISNDPQLTNLTGLNNLQRVGGDLRLESNQALTSIAALTALTSVGVNLQISSDAQLTNLMGLSNLKTVGVDLQINSNPTLTSIAALTALTSVGSKLQISNNAQLTNLMGLSNLKTVGGDLQINSNPTLTSIAALTALTSVGNNLQISSDAQLTNLTGLGNLKTVGGNLQINNNQALTSIAALTALTSVGASLLISNDAQLTNLTGLGNLKTVGGDLQINNNQALTSIAALTALTSVGSRLLISNNAQLTNLTGLNNLQQVGGDFQINNNQALAVCALPAICQLIATKSPDQLKISGNAPGCSSVEDVQSNCLSITAQPASASAVCVGATVTTAVATSGNVRAYQWYRDGTPVTGQTSATLTLSNVQTSQSGAYRVVVSNSVNSLTSTAFNLTVTPFSSDYQPLVDLYNATNGASWTRNDNWLSGCSPCGWYGVTCDGNNRVTGINLIGNNLSGTLPASLSALSALTSLELGANTLTGGIPTGIGSLTNLQTLNLSRTQLGGSIPASLGQLSQLQNLLLNESGLTGTLPASLGNLTQLQNLQLYANQLSGCFPASYTSLCDNNVSFVNNPGLPGGGDFAAFCRDGSGGQLVVSQYPQSGTACVGNAFSFSVVARGAGSYQWYKDGQRLAETGPVLSFSSVSSADAGSYQVYINYGCGNGAVQSDAVTLTVSGGVASLTSSSPLSCAATSVTLTAGGSAVNAGASYRFSSGATQIGQGPTATVTTTGLYSVTVTSGSGCLAVASTSVTGDQNTPSVSINPSSATLTCEKPSALLTAVGSGAVRWSTGSTDSQITVTKAGLYSVTLTSENSCSAVAQATVTADQTTPVASLTANGTLSCTNTSVTLTAIGSGTGSPFTYRFSEGATQAGTGNTATVTTAGIYSVTVLSANGCSSVASTTVTGDQSVPTVRINPSSATLTCANPSATLTAVGTGNFRWSTGSTDSQITVTTAGTYSLTLTSGNGCVAMSSAVVTSEQTAPAVSINPTRGTLTCASPSLTLTATTSASALRWSTGQTTPSITVTIAGTYSVTATGANGCSATSNSVVIESSQSAPPATLVASGGLSCAVSSVTLTANAGDGLSYRFSEGATQVGNGNTATVNLAGTYSVTVTSTATGCTSTVSVVVNQDNSQPVVNITPTTATLTCAMPTVTLTANTAVTSLTWSTGQTTATISVSLAGTYSVTVSSANGCRAMAMATVNGTTDAPGAPTLTASPAISTTNQPITVTANGCTNGMINWTVLGGSGQASGNTYTLTQPGNYTLSATCSLNGCTSGASAPLSVQIRPGGFAITGVSMVNCQLIDEAKGGYQVQFTPQYAGQSSSPISFSVVNELATTTAPAPYSLRLYTDNPVITLVATQTGSGEARFAYNWLASCQSSTSPNQPPTTTGIPNQTIVQDQAYQLQLTTYFSDPDGQTLSFQASGLPTGLTLNGSVISGTPSQTGVSTVNVTALDPGGLTANTSFQLTVSPQPVTPPTGFAIVGASTVSCQVISAGERRLTFTPQYAGVSGEPISFSVVNEKLPTTDAGPYTLNLYTDNPSITLSAQQGSAVSTYRYNWLAVCTPAARVSAGEAGLDLQVRVLGNPVMDQTAEVEISGVMGQSVQLKLVDLQGKLAHTQRIEQAGAVERVSLPLGASNGVLLLQVSTPTQHQQVKLLRTN
ncbi:beta strand repeat-containing protein [Spirosoma agri]|uniref:Ig-like domain-containing protein n=1 Tax=Spirosoma agri TaxID=1987381 RepID=A0A6M0IDC7_9BACT|nr:putative Ig domain-containing protein [Spirosoma agri]NEU66296.1 hypothetical protein [Spirosoma agri]